MFTPAADSLSPGMASPPRAQDNTVRYPTRQHIRCGVGKTVVEIWVRLSILKILLKNYGNLRDVITIMRALRKVRRKVHGNKPIMKVACVAGKYYWDLYAPGYGSKSFEAFILGEAGRIVPGKKPTNRFTNIFVAFTKKCPLQCQHCFEWDALNRQEVLGMTAIKDIISRFQQRGTSIIHLTGGEPLLRVNDIIDIIQSAKQETEFWVLTSGYNLSFENGRKLKSAGLTGIIVSLDHFDSDSHNHFRGTAKSFEWVNTAVRNAIANNLVTALSICVTRTFVSEPNLMAYATLARDMGVSFVQILEPKAVGHYAGMDVSLKDEHLRTLKDFYLKMNFDRNYAQFPIISYQGYHQREMGCFGSGDRNLYVDTDGDLHACPFCQGKVGHALSDDLDISIERLKVTGCHAFKDAASSRLF